MRSPNIAKPATVRSAIEANIAAEQALKFASFGDECRNVSFEQIAAAIKYNREVIDSKLRSALMKSEQIEKLNRSLKG